MSTSHFYKSNCRRNYLRNKTSTLTNRSVHFSNNWALIPWLSSLERRVRHCRAERHGFEPQSVLDFLPGT